MSEVIEVALVFDVEGRVLYWHLPPGRSGGAIPDSRNLWEVLWENRERLGGVAHTHPWYGDTGPSGTDVTTFAAIEAGLGKRLLWPIVTFDRVVMLKWSGPEKFSYSRFTEGTLRVDGIERLRDLSGR